MGGAAVSKGCQKTLRHRHAAGCRGRQGGPGQRRGPLVFSGAGEGARVVRRAAKESRAACRTLPVGQALDQYEADLRMRGGDTGNVARVRHHLSGALSQKSVELIEAKVLRHWRDELAKK